MKKLTSWLLVYCILLIQVGCVTTRYLSFEQAAEAKHKKFLVLHTPKQVFNLYNYTFTDEGLNGTLKPVISERLVNLHVYTNLHFDLKDSQISSNQIFIPKSNITNLTVPSLGAGKTLLIIGAGIGLATLVMWVIAIGSVDFGI